MIYSIRKVRIYRFRPLARCLPSSHVVVILDNILQVETASTVSKVREDDGAQEGATAVLGATRCTHRGVEA